MFFFIVAFVCRINAQIDLVFQPETYIRNPVPYYSLNDNCIASAKYCWYTIGKESGEMGKIFYPEKEISGHLNTIDIFRIYHETDTSVIYDNTGVVAGRENFAGRIKKLCCGEGNVTCSLKVKALVFYD